ncbi:hypothetical protein [Methylocystis sp. JR02]|uniref:hypothetical protein n=1 Tax=Methylocystis sp. JR02 TaxID=3046284 RepID=UPI0024BAD394|nr:hypothetical protein [Methylocystis sp. JR02]MDJ0449228.1 hypothetical protein [Methylocystis sp. JR02]
MMAVQRKSYGRYDRVEEAVHPGPALPHAPKRMKGKIEIVTAAVEDPNPVGSEKLRRQRVAVNIAGDTLEREYAYGRISTPAYQVGVIYRETIESSCGRLRHPTTFELSGGRGSQELLIIRRMEIAERAVAIQEEVRSAIGETDEQLLRAVLGDGLTFGEIARLEGRHGKRAMARIATRFREALQALATDWRQRGR